MTDYLRQKWLRLRLFRSRRMLEINYRIIRNTAKLMGMRA
ncbi:YlcG family protein [Erwiniaceae bacterium BAC15a-03b]|uniref:YlcG family protein n=1 Tax=Winslowiella arboricola TaxID=2978220 RepID=A0A9J6PZV4_9GAMM|nr:YlcG family protein [Winslowiella arboricola]MCU5775102.1 YlcG family protein [Winslowiella arboricola]MCU5780444.1 YlcG family protein [Winslowiella arboricola]